MQAIGILTVEEIFHRLVGIELTHGTDMNGVGDLFIADDMARKRAEFVKRAPHSRGR